MIENDEFAVTAEAELRRIIAGHLAQIKDLEKQCRVYRASIRMLEAELAREKSGGKGVQPNPDRTKEVNT